VVGGKNFGCGSSREQAPLALKYAGVQCVLAESFARIFFRNAINIGLPAIESKGVSAAVEEGNVLEVDFEAGTVQNVTKMQNLQANKLPPFIVEILSDGGLIENLRKRRWNRPRIDRGNSESSRGSTNQIRTETENDSS
jgi:3-isopropylmalate/(R)-2-methylmalate dehydratase small subunit